MPLYDAVALAIQPVLDPAPATCRPRRARLHRPEPNEPPLPGDDPDNPDHPPGQPPDPDRLPGEPMPLPIGDPPAPVHAPQSGDVPCAFTPRVTRRHRALHDHPDARRHGGARHRAAPHRAVISRWHLTRTPSIPPTNCPARVRVGRAHVLMYRLQNLRTFYRQITVPSSRLRGCHLPVAAFPGGNRS